MPNCVSANNYAAFRLSQSLHKCSYQNMERYRKGMAFTVLRVVAVVVRSVLKSGETRELLKQLFDWAKERPWSKRRKTDWKGKAGLIGGLLVTALMVASLLWMHQRIGIIEERLMTIEERQRGNVTVGN